MREKASSFETIIAKSCSGILFLLCAAGIHAQYPLIAELSGRDPVFKQLASDLELYYKNSAQQQELPSLVLYEYRTKKDETLFSLAARTNLPYETVATLNRIEHPLTFPAGTRLVLPNLPGIFMPKDPESELEHLMIAWRKDSQATPQRFTVSIHGKAQDFLFYVSERFHSVERAYFLQILFRFPLPKGKLSSAFGMRLQPFTGHASFHNGIDLAAPEGTEVYAARNGKVQESGNDPVLGDYLVLSHTGGWESVYGHLSKKLVELNQDVYSGMIIGEVGNTGLSTGPHLHFEVRNQGKPKDPMLLIPRVNK